MVLGSSGERLDNACSCLAERGKQEFREGDMSAALSCFALIHCDRYLSVLLGGQSSLLGHWRRSGHNPGSRAKPFRWPQRHGCSPSSVPHRCCGTVWSSCYFHRARRAQSSLWGVSQGSTPRWAGHGWHSGGGTLPLTRPPNGSGGQGCWGKWSWNKCEHSYNQLSMNLKQESAA